MQVICRVGRQHPADSKLCVQSLCPCHSVVFIDIPGCLQAILELRRVRRRFVQQRGKTLQGPCRVQDSLDTMCAHKDSKLLTLDLQVSDLATQMVQVTLRAMADEAGCKQSLHSMPQLQTPAVTPIRCVDHAAVHLRCCADVHGKAATDAAHTSQPRSVSSPDFLQTQNQTTLQRSNVFAQATLQASPVRARRIA